MNAQYAGWLRAIRRGHLRVHKGLGLPVPVLVLSSDRSVHPSEWEPAVDESDIVLDVNLMARWAFKLGGHVMLAQVPGAPTGGAGLGLAISRLIVEAHGGQISAQSELGHGATFIFTLPCLNTF